ncbi:2-hydroxychromene-2-carboxylate isomerase [Oxalobacteraceae bacterium]|nr:2-hydroxychromene-2-carboxylate isomerase [Oxalobacteraceae bacterium]
MDSVSEGPDWPEMEFLFEFASNYSYLSVMRIGALARAARVRVRWRPLLLGPIFRDMGWNNSPFVLQEQKGRYVWKDWARQADKHGLAHQRPTQFPRASMLPMRVATLAQDQPWMEAFCQAVMRQNFVEDVDINDPKNVLRALRGLVDDPAVLLVRAAEEPNKSRLREQTAQAQQRGVFGAPTFFVGEEMFWGDDRLEDALAWAVKGSKSTRR